MEILLIAAIIGLLPAAIASSKGRSFVLWWLYGAGLFLFAMIHAIVLKPTQNAILRDPSFRQCPHCAEAIKREARVCRYCGRESIDKFSDGDSTVDLVCPRCHSEVLLTHTQCHSCGARILDARRDLERANRLRKSRIFVRVG